MRTDFLAKETGSHPDILADYYALIQHLDERIGDIVEVLKKNGLYDNTIIVYAADNGLGCRQSWIVGQTESV
jgi:arylsulfatase A-like enzyme